MACASNVFFAIKAIAETLSHSGLDLSRHAQDMHLLGASRSPCTHSLALQVSSRFKKIFTRGSRSTPPPSTRVRFPSKPVTATWGPRPNDRTASWLGTTPSQHTGRRRLRRKQSSSNANVFQQWCDDHQIGWPPTSKRSSVLSRLGSMLPLKQLVPKRFTTRGNMRSSSRFHSSADRIWGGCPREQGHRVFKVALQ